MPNDLSIALEKIMQTELGDMGKHVIKKQCKSLDMDPDNIRPQDLPRLANALSGSMKLFGTDKAKNLYNKIRKLQNFKEIIESQSNLETKISSSPLLFSWNALT